MLKQRARRSLAVAALLTAGLLIVAPAADAQQDASAAKRPFAMAAPAEAADAKPVDLRVGEHRFRIPRAYFRHPPHPGGVGTGFYIRAFWPGMEPETEANRAAFQASIRTDEGQRVLQILLVPTRPGMPWPVARWMMQNLASGPGRAEADRVDVEAFPPPSPETFGLRALPGKPLPGSTWVHDDLLHGALPDGRFAGMRCGRDPDPDSDRLRSCKLWFDWRPGARLEVTFIRTQLPRWREIAEAALALVDGFAAGGPGGVGH